MYGETQVICPNCGGRNLYQPSEQTTTVVRWWCVNCRQLVNPIMVYIPETYKLLPKEYQLKGSEWAYTLQ